MSIVSLQNRRAAWLLVLLVVVCAALVCHEATRRYLSSHDAVHRTLSVRGAISDTLSTLKDAETGQRGYLLTGNETFLAPYEDAARDIDAQMVHLRDLTSDDPGQARSTRVVEELAADKLAFIATTIALRRDGAQEAALEAVREGKGNRIMTELRAETERMLDRESDRLLEREATAASDETHALCALGAGLVLMLVVVLGGLATVRRDVSELRHANDELHRSEQALKMLAENAIDLVRILDADSQDVYVSPSCTTLLGYRPEEMLAMKPRALLHPDDAHDARALADRLRSSTGASETFVHRMRHKDGSYRWFESRIHSVVGPSGETGRLHLASRDVTAGRVAEEARRIAEEELKENEQRFRVLSESSFEGVAISKGGIIVEANANFAAWLGRERDELVGVDGLTLFVPEDRDRVLRGGSIEPMYEARLIRSDGTILHAEVRGRNAMLHGEAVRIAVVRDITERKAREAEAEEQARQLREMSLRDELTGLFNRRGFLEHARQQLRNAVRQNRPVCLFFADLNGLKLINDELGHDAGDRAIASAGALLSTVFRESDIVSRLGGDEFAILASNCASSDVPTVTARLEKAISAFNAHSLDRFRLSLSIGAAVCDAGEPLELDRLIEIADARMYDDKRANGRARLTAVRACS